MERCWIAINDTHDYNDSYYWHTQSDCLLRTPEFEKKKADWNSEFLIFWIIVYQKAQRSFILQLDPMFGMSGFTFKVMCLLSTPTGAKVIWQIELVVKNVRAHRQSVGNERFQEKVSPSLLQKAGDQKKKKKRFMTGLWTGNLVEGKRQLHWFL